MNLATASRSRASDPTTSHQAAEASVRFAGGHAARILYVVQNADSHGLCAAEIGEACGLTVVQVDRRTVELQRKGLIRVLQRDGKDVTAHGMRVWVAV